MHLNFNATKLPDTKLIVRKKLPRHFKRNFLNNLPSPRPLWLYTDNPGYIHSCQGSLVTWWCRRAPWIDSYNLETKINISRFKQKSGHSTGGIFHAFLKLKCFGFAIDKTLTLEILCDFMLYLQCIFKVSFDAVDGLAPLSVRYNGDFFRVLYTNGSALERLTHLSRDKMAAIS